MRVEVASDGSERSGLVLLHTQRAAGVDDEDVRLSPVIVHHQRRCRRLVQTHIRRRQKRRSSSSA